MKENTIKKFGDAMARKTMAEIEEVKEKMPPDEFERIKKICERLLDESDEVEIEILLEDNKFELSIFYNLLYG
jgi:hypothetical protein